MKRKLLRTVGWLYFKVEKVINFFKKDAHIFVNYVHESADGKLIKHQDSFQIYICQYGKCNGLFSRIDWNEHKKIVDLLKNSNGKVLLEMDVGLGQSNLLIPKWAKSKLIEQIEKESQSN